MVAAHGSRYAFCSGLSSRIHKFIYARLHWIVNNLSLIMFTSMTANFLLIFITLDCLYDLIVYCLVFTRLAVEMNMLGVRKMIELCQTFKKLEVGEVVLPQL